MGNDCTIQCKQKQNIIKIVFLQISLITKRFVIDKDSKINSDDVD